MGSAAAAASVSSRMVCHKLKPAVFKWSFFMSDDVGKSIWSAVSYRLYYFFGRGFENEFEILCFCLKFLGNVLILRQV